MRLVSGLSIEEVLTETNVPGRNSIVIVAILDSISAVKRWGKPVDSRDHGRVILLCLLSNNRTCTRNLQVSLIIRLSIYTEYEVYDEFRAFSKAGDPTSPQLISVTQVLQGFDR